LAANAGLRMVIGSMKMEMEILFMLREIQLYVTIHHVQQKLKIDENANVEKQSSRMEEHIPDIFVVRSAVSLNLHQDNL